MDRPLGKLAEYLIKKRILRYSFDFSDHYQRRDARVKLNFEAKAPCGRGPRRINADRLMVLKPHGPAHARPMRVCIVRLLGDRRTGVAAPYCSVPPVQTLSAGNHVGDSTGPVDPARSATAQSNGCHRRGRQRRWLSRQRGCASACCTR